MKRENAIARFHSKIARGSSTECWLWNACVDQDGYGFFYLNKKKQRAHRFALQLSGVDIPDGLVVMHACDVPRCCNPAHLSVGTFAENRLDCVRKKRQAKGEKSGAHTMPWRRARGDRAGARVHPERVARGVDVSTAKLSESDVIEIRQLNASGISQKALANRFGVRQCTISSAVRRETWKHVA